MTNSTFFFSKYFHLVPFFPPNKPLDYETLSFWVPSGLHLEEITNHYIACSKA
jgi:hypothetical protein